jgi:hypothetical protein
VGRRSTRAGYTIPPDQVEHVLVDFVATGPDLVAALRLPSSRLPAALDVAFADRDEFRRVARFRVGNREELVMDGEWRQFDTSQSPRGARDR